MTANGGSGGRIATWSTAIVGLVLCAFVFGFVLFANVATRQPPATVARADAIVVLTGGDQRIEEGVRLLNAGYGGRLLISGVNRRTSKEDVRRLTGLNPTLFECCVEIGYAALDTAGNADETRQWVAARRVSSLIVVTSSYHMPRSLAEMARALPGIELIPYPVLPRSFRADQWWLSMSTIRVLVGEYLKYLPTAARCRLSRLMMGDGVGRAVTADAASRSPR